ncbi:hypothetical protein O3M35_001211 [Rhynocoris fuscipes]|uniref:G patch domain-containing protein 4 n=1 Tax=Rhynocoris fuscipes TaxID=488301 RepID=A0AAW1DPL4_9HEMI
MNFARSELMKYGWKEGDGLGKNSAGIIQPVRPKLKFDTRGVGFDYGEDYSFKWWEHVYDKAASNIYINSSEDGATLEPKNEKPLHAYRKKVKSKKMNNSLRSKYNTFIKGAVLQNNSEIDCVKTENGDRLRIFKSENINENTYDSNKSSVPKIKKKLTGKQLRLQLQEEQYLLNNVRINTDS